MAPASSLPVIKILLRGCSAHIVAQAINVKVYGSAGNAMVDSDQILVSPLRSKYVMLTMA